MLVLSFHCPAQTGVAVSFKDTTSIKDLIKHARKQTDFDSAKALFEEAKQRSLKLSYWEGAVHAMLFLGMRYVDIGNYPEGKTHFEEAISYCLKTKDSADLALCYNDMAIPYSNEGDYLKATEYYFKALEDLKRQNRPYSSSAAYIYNNLAVIYFKLDQNEQALKYLKQGQELAQKGKFDYQLCAILGNIGNYYSQVHKLDSTRKYYLEELNLSRKNDYVDMQAGATVSLGQALIDASEYEQAIPYLKMAMELSKNRYNYYFIAASYSLGEAWYKLTKYQEAERILLSGLNKADTLNIRDDKVRGYTTLANIYKTTKQYAKAISTLEKLEILKDSLTSTEKIKAINQLEVKFKTAEKDKVIAQNQVLIAQQNTKIARKNTLMTIVFGGIILLGLTFVGLYRSSKTKQRLQAQQILSLQQENKIGILKAIVQGEEKERSRIARELHDGIGGMLSATMMRYMTIHHYNKEIANIPAYDEVMDMLSEMGDEIRKTAHNLMPEVLLKQNLPDAVQSFCSLIQESGALKIDFQYFGMFDTITQEFKLTIYRILQELIKNITQHAQANHALVQLLMHEQLLAITVEDNGKGFIVNDSKKGIGLFNLQTRISSLDGRFTMESEPGKGTSVYIEFDIEQVTTNETT